MVRLDRVSKSFAGVRALDAIDCTIARGSVTAIVGANGSGKSTMLRVIAGALSPDSGSVSILGEQRGAHSSMQRTVGYAGQDLALDPEMTGLETLRLFYALRGLPHRDRDMRIENIIADYELGRFSDRAIAGYSGGQRQRLHLALETMHVPTLLILDEPTASLDPDGRRLLWTRLIRQRASGQTTIIATHDLADVEQSCDRVIVLAHGRIVGDDSPALIVAAHGRSRTTITLSSAPADIAALRDAIDVAMRRAPDNDDTDVLITDASIIVSRTHGHDGDDVILATLASQGVEYSRIERSDSNLASAYFGLTGSSAAAMSRGSDSTSAGMSDGAGARVGSRGGQQQGGGRGSGVGSGSGGGSGGVSGRGSGVGGGRGRGTGGGGRNRT
ncbi:MAG: ABC transporter ATP-binding protein [bacterium]|nr:ABC transporter ATP-binding protein [Candidatus Kapabacteria bacterium]